VSRAMTNHRITARALCQRINRKLRWSGQILKCARGKDRTLREYYVLNVERDFVVRHDVRLEDYARELGVLQPSEILSWGRYKDVRRMHDSGMTLRAIGQQFGVSRQRVHQILKGDGKRSQRN
jgi:hypothetical protein